MKWFRWLLLLGLAVSAQAAAALLDDSAVQASMQLKAKIAIDAEGRVSDFQIQRANEVPPGVVKIVDGIARQWEFDPVVIDGTPVAVTSSCWLWVLAKHLDDGRSQVAVRGVSFREPGKPPTNEVQADGPLAIPKWPGSGAEHVQANVYLMAKIGPDGRVADAIAEQVNLRALVPTKQAGKLRDAFANSALAVVHDWKFTPPATGPLAGEPFWTVRVPVAYSFPDPKSGYGQWEAYVPGPRQRASWDQPPALASEALEALPEGVYTLGAPETLQLHEGAIPDDGADHG